MGYRSRLEIIADILKAAGDGSRKTRIMYFANLSYRLLERYLARVIEARLLSRNGERYEITEKGKIFLEKFEIYSRKESRVRKEIESLKFERQVLEQMCEMG
jgi:predicted transcriptional regulator